MNNPRKTEVFIPDSKKQAEQILEIYLKTRPQPETTLNRELLKIWHCIAYLNPGLHPDEIDKSEGGWPEHYIPYLLEILKWHERGEITDEELYPADAQWAGLCDQLESLSNEEADRRRYLRNLMNARPPALIWDARTTVIFEGKTSSYRDFYEAATEVEAQALWEFERKKYGLPECATVTLQQVPNSWTDYD